MKSFFLVFAVAVLLSQRLWSLPEPLLLALAGSGLVVLGSLVRHAKSPGDAPRESAGSFAHRHVPAHGARH